MDYIAEHIHPVTGRAGIIVPEGIIFQSANAYKALRKMLVDKKYLYAVASLPAGIFQPYSGVKTSILFLDKNLAKKTDNILFVKIDNDGFDLGAQRRAIDKNDLTDALTILQETKSLIEEGKSDYKKPLEEWIKNHTNPLIKKIIAPTVTKKKVAEKGDYNLSVDRYRVNENVRQSEFEMVRLGDVCEVINGKAYKQEELLEIGKYPVLRVGNFFSNRSWYYSDLELEENKYCKKGDLLYAWSASFGPKIWDGEKSIYHYHVWKMIPNESKINKFFLYYILDRETESIKAEGGRGIAMIHITKGGIEEREIPLPPLSIQQQIVSKIESYQAIINGAKQVVENYKPQIDIDPDWEMVELGEVCEKLTDGSHFSPPTKDIGYPYITVKDIIGDRIDFHNCKFVDKSDYEELLKNDCNPLLNDILFSKDGTIGKVSLVDFEKEFVVLSSLAIIRPKIKVVIPSYLKIVFQSDYFLNQAIENKTGVAIKRIVLKTLKTIPIPLPPLSIQQQIVTRIGQEQQLVNANKELIKIYRQKVKDEIDKLWKKEAKGFAKLILV